MPANRHVKLYATLNNLNKPDLYSLILFTLYKLKDNPEYSTLSELCYILDEPNLINMLTYYGGTTITIPTLQELRLILSALSIYHQVNLEGVPYSSALKNCSSGEFTPKEVESAYQKVAEVVSNYSFQKRED